MKNIAFSPPDITQEEIDEVVDTLKSGWITTGPKTKRFEKEIAAYCHTQRAVTLNSATACMEMTLRLLGIGAGDEVITTAYTYSASASVIDHVGAKIILLDVAKGSYHIDYDAIAAAITERTKAIIPVDIAGVMCDYDRIFEAVEGMRSKFCPSNQLQEAFGRVIVIADAAHSMGAWYKGRRSGSVADFTSFSFHAVKNLTTAEGGAVTWNPVKGFNDDYIYNQFMLLTLHGQSKDALAKTKLGAWEYDIIAPNYKCNMTDIMASIGLVQLKRYEGILAKRKALIQRYEHCLKEVNVSGIQHFNKHDSSSGHLYLVQLKGMKEVRRNAVIEKMASLGVATNVHYKPIPMLTAYRNLGFDISRYPNAFSMYQSEITLPLHTLLNEEDVEFVCCCLKKTLE